MNMNTEDNNPEKIDHFKNAAELIVELVSNEVIRKLNIKKIPQGDLVYKKGELV